MKKLFLFLSLLSFLACAGQDRPQPIGAPNRNIQVLGGMYVDSALYLPIARPLSSLYRPGAVMYQISDSSLYTWTGYQWLKQHGGGGGGGGGATNLGRTLSANSITVTNDNGTGFVIPSGDGTNAGLVPASKWNEWNAKLGNVNVTVTPSPGSVGIGSSAGTGGIIPPVDGTNAGVITPAMKALWDGRLAFVNVVSPLEGAGTTDNPLRIKGIPSSPGPNKKWVTDETGQWVIRPDTSSGGGGSAVVRFVDITMADLNASTGLDSSNVYWIKDPGREGPFVWRGKALNQVGENFGTVIITEDLNYYERVHDGRLDVRWFGARADGWVQGFEDTARGTDNGPMIQATINAAKPGQCVYIPRHNDSLYVIRTELDTIKNKPTNLWIDGYIITNGRTAVRFAGPSSGEERIHAIFGNGILYGKVNLPRHIYENYQSGTGPDWNALTGSGIEYINVHRLSVRLQRVEGFRYGVRSRNGAVPGILQYGSQENTFAIKYYQKNGVAISLESINGSSYCDKTIFTGWDGGSSRVSGGLAINIDGYAPVVGDGTYNGAFRSLKFFLLVERVDSAVNANGDITEALFDFTFENGTETGIFGRGIQAKSSGANYLRNPRWKFRGAVCTQHMVDSMGRGGSIEGSIYLNCTTLLANEADINEYGQIELKTRKLSLYLRSLLPPIFRVVDKPYLNDEIVVSATNYTPGDTGRTFRMTNGGTFNLPGTAATPNREIVLINDHASNSITVTGVKSGFNSVVGPRKSAKFFTNGLTWYPMWEPPSSSGGGGGNPTAGDFSNTPTAKGLSTSGSDVILHPADSTNPGAVSTGNQKWQGGKQMDSASMPVLSMWRHDYGKLDIVRRKNGLSFNDAYGTPNENSSTLTAFNFGSGSSSKDILFGFGKTGVNWVGMGNDGTDMIFVTEKSTGGFEFRKQVGYTNATLQSGSALAKIFGSSGNMLLQTGGTFTDAGYKLDVKGTFRTSGANRMENLAGTGTRMVVADANGTLSTQTIPSGGGGGSTIFTAGSGTGSPYYRDAGPVNIGVNPSQSYAWTHWGASTSTRALWELSSTSSWVTTPRKHAIDYDALTSRLRLQNANGFSEVFATDINPMTLYNKIWGGVDITPAYIDAAGSSAGDVLYSNGVDGYAAGAPKYSLVYSATSTVTYTNSVSETDLFSYKTLPTLAVGDVIVVKGAGKLETAAVPDGNIIFRLKFNGSTGVAELPTSDLAIGDLPAGTKQYEFEYRFIVTSITPGLSFLKQSSIELENGGAYEFVKKDNSTLALVTANTSPASLKVTVQWRNGTASSDNILTHAFQTIELYKK